MTETRYAIASYDTGMPGITLTPSYSTCKAVLDQEKVIVRNALIRVCNMSAKSAEAAIAHAISHPAERSVCEFDDDMGIAKVHYFIGGKPEVLWFQVVKIR